PRLNSHVPPPLVPDGRKVPEIVQKPSTFHTIEKNITNMLKIWQENLVIFNRNVKIKPLFVPILH
ncbi:MAG: hypothetical protein IJZ82_02875, partial [Lachnospiraceae bacterium]|nr:hypothetical protein [Lachnospiraceae bacterium]